MKILIELLLVFSLTFQVTKLQILNLDNTYSLDNKMPRNYYGATFINTDGIQKLCTSHADCYEMREPIYWCRLKRNQHWTEKGCYCDSVLRACIIERMTDLGPASKIRNYAYCTPRAFWNCPPLQYL
ncbi:Chromadorea ALT family protein [Brugia pahangi]|uniref:Secreted protein n=1 Tax=Brugia pahangi TaxID=6280 RepID=A0A0N4T497_BRUPA|nr:unnamed protein product [Brugia pahangi]